MGGGAGWYKGNRFFLTRSKSMYLQMKCVSLVWQLKSGMGPIQHQSEFMLKLRN